jgi:hypothetical protein
LLLLAAVSLASGLASASAAAQKIAVVASDQPAFAEAARAAVDAIGADAVLVRADDSANDAVLSAAVTVAVGPLAERLVAGILPKGSHEVACLVPRAANAVAVPLRPSVTEVLSLIKIAVPNARTVGVFPASGTTAAEVEAAARGLGLSVVTPRSDEAFASATDRLVTTSDVLWIEDSSAVPNGGTAVVVKRASDSKKPVLGPNRASVLAGALFAVVPDPVAHGRSAADAALRLARGEDVVGIPPPEGRIVLNQALARTLGIKLPASMAKRIETVE